MSAPWRIKLDKGVSLGNECIKVIITQCIKSFCGHGKFNNLGFNLFNFGFLVKILRLSFKKCIDLSEALYKGTLVDIGLLFSLTSDRWALSV